MALNNSQRPDTWNSDWVDVSTVPGAADAWAHSGLAVTAEGDVVGFHAGQLAFFGSEGTLKRTVRTDLAEGHGLTVVGDAGQEVLWITDPGVAVRRNPGSGSRDGLDRTHDVPRVVQMSLSGALLQELPSPPVSEDGYRPTSVVVDVEATGGDGSIWVADGYGSSLVHKYSSEGRHEMYLSGEEGAGRFLCPHSILLTARNGVKELYIADRGNRRIQVYDLDGRYKRQIGPPLLSTPSGFAEFSEGFLVVAELHARLALFDPSDQFVGYIGENIAVVDLPGWPNALDGEKVVRSTLLEAGTFNSPHALIVDQKGNLIVSEWLIGGRYTKISSEFGPVGR